MRKKQKCCICGETFIGWGNEPWPIKNDGRCCDTCNSLIVLPARIMALHGLMKPDESEDDDRKYGV